LFKSIIFADIAAGSRPLRYTLPRLTGIISLLVLAHLAAAAPHVIAQLESVLLKEAVELHCGPADPEGSLPPMNEEASPAAETTLSLIAHRLSIHGMG